MSLPLPRVELRYDEPDLDSLAEDEEPNYDALNVRAVLVLEGGEQHLTATQAGAVDRARASAVFLTSALPSWAYQEVALQVTEQLGRYWEETEPEWREEDSTLVVGFRAYSNAGV